MSKQFAGLRVIGDVRYEAGKIVSDDEAAAIIASNVGIVESDFVEAIEEAAVVAPSEINADSSADLDSAAPAVDEKKDADQSTSDGSDSAAGSDSSIDASA